MTKECIWYNGETASYELLDFDPNDCKDEQEIKTQAIKVLREKWQFSDEDLEKAKKTIYLIDIDNLDNLFQR